MKLNRRNFLAGYMSVLPALFLSRLGYGKLAKKLPADIPLQDIVRINGVVFEHAKAKEVFEYDDYYLHVKMPMWKEFPGWLRFYRALQGRSLAEFSSDKHKIEVIQRHIEQKYTGVYYGYIRYDDDSPEPSITLHFLLESLASSLIARPKTCLFTNYSMLKQWKKDSIRLGV